MNMFDKIVLNMQIVEPEIIGNLISRFKLEKSEMSNVYTNRRVKDLSHYGITVKYNSDKKQNFQFIFSAHKFWNLRNGKGYQSINDFSFKDFNSTYTDFISYINLEHINYASVHSLEIGVNFYSGIEYGFFALKIKGIFIHGKLNEILDDSYLNESSLAGTRQTKYKRVVFVLYDKSKETKAKDPKGIDLIPSNILRFEKRKIRLENVQFSDLKTKEFQSKSKAELLKDISGILWISKESEELKIYLKYCNHGLEFIKNENETELKYSGISERTYYRKKQIISKIESYKPPVINEDWKEYFEEKITKKIETL